MDYSSTCHTIWPSARPIDLRLGSQVKRLSALFVFIATLTAILITSLPAHAAPDPLTCEGYPEPRVFIEAQSWWTEDDVDDPHFREHIHVGTCFPIHQKVSGDSITFDVRVVTHAISPGSVLNRTRIHTATDSGGEPASTIDWGDAVVGGIPNKMFWGKATLDLTQFDVSGYQEFRFLTEVIHGDGDEYRISTGWQAFIDNGKPRDDYRDNEADNPRIEARGWYSTRNYQNSRIEQLMTKADALAGGYQVSGVWEPHIRTAAGAGGSTPEFTQVVIDAYHHFEGYLEEVHRGTGTYEGDLSIDTTRLTDGLHKLVLRNDDIQTEGTDPGTLSGVQIVPFIVNNGGGAPPVPDPDVPDITVNPTSYNFGDVVAGSTSASHTFVVRNDGNAELNVSATTLSGGGEFSINAGNVSSPGMTLSPGQSHNVVVSINPTGPGAQSGTLQITSDDPDEGTVVVALNGNGTAPDPGNTVAPALSKNFAPSAIISGGTSTLTLNIDNSVNATSLTTLALSDAYPAGIANATPTNATTTCAGGSIVTAADGGTSLTLSGGTVAAGASCTVSVDVTSSTVGAHLNTTGVVSSTEAPDSTTASDTLTVLTAGGSGTFQPTDDARVSFKYPTRNYGSKDLLRVRDASNNSYESYLKFAVTGLAGSAASAKLWLYVTDGSPDGGDVYLTGNGWDESAITANNAPGINGSPIASVGAVPDGIWIEIDVTNFINGNGDYSFGLRSASSNSAFYSSKEGANPPKLVIQQSGDNGPAAPTLSKSFAPNSITSGGQSTLTLTIDNSANTAPLNALALNDTYPAAIANVNPNNATTTCGGGIVTAANGGSSVTLSGGTVAAGASCTVMVDVTSATVGDHLNTTGTVSSAEAPISGTASDTLIVNADGGGGSQTLQSTDDARVSFNYPTKNYGSSDYVRARDNNDNSYESYLKFEVTGLTGLVTSATLRLYVTDGSPDGGDVYLVGNGWDESSITANNAPGISGSPVASAGTVDNGTWIEIDVTSAINGNGDYSFGLRSASSNSVRYSSKEGANPPELVVVP